MLKERKLLMSEENKITILGDKEKDYLMAKSAATLPKNPSEQGWSWDKILKTFHEPLQVIFKWLQATQGEAELEIQKIYSDIYDIVNGQTTVSKAEKDAEGNTILYYYAHRLSMQYEENSITFELQNGDGNPLNDGIITIPLVTTENDGLMSTIDKENLDGLLDGERTAKKAELDDDGNTIKRTYLNKLNRIQIVPSASSVSVLVEATRPSGNFQNPPFSSVSEDIPASTTMNAGVMSATDKSRLDQLWAVLQDSSDPTFVDTINEILTIFANYPEGMDIIAQFATKVDKVEGKGLSANDYTDEEKNIVANAASKEYVDEGDETIQVHNLDNATVERVMFVIENGQPILRIE